jgi:hypothetical protein
MRKWMVLAMPLAMFLCLSAIGVPVLTQAAPQMSASDDKNPPLMTLQGTVNADGDKINFVNDKDGKSWMVINPETLKAHVGHHVELSAHVYADKMQIHVMNVKMMKSAGN